MFFFKSSYVVVDVSSTVFMTPVKADSQSTAAFTDVPKAVTTGVVTYVVICCPKPEILFPTSLIFWPTSCTFCPAICIWVPSTEDDCLACDSSSFNAAVSRSIWSFKSSAALAFFWNSSAWSRSKGWSNFSLSCSRAFFSSSILFCVASTCLPSSCCLSFRRVVFEGSNLRALLMSRRFCCVLDMALSTAERALTSLVVSPPISIVMPLILPAAILLSPRIYRNLPETRSPCICSCRYRVPLSYPRQTHNLNHPARRVLVRAGCIAIHTWVL